MYLKYYGNAALSLCVKSFSIVDPGAKRYYSDEYARYEKLFFDELTTIETEQSGKAYDCGAILDWYLGHLGIETELPAGLCAI